MLLDNMGSTGNSAIFLPNLVSSPRWFNAPRAYNCSSANTRVSCGGGSMKSKWIKSFIPKLFKSNTTFPRLVLWISGTVLSSSSCLYAHAVYSLKHFPAETRPALPALWLEEAWKESTDARLKVRSDFFLLSQVCFHIQMWNEYYIIFLSTSFHCVFPISSPRDQYKITSLSQNMHDPTFIVNLSFLYIW